MVAQNPHDGLPKQCNDALWLIGLRYPRNWKMFQIHAGETKITKEQLDVLHTKLVCGCMWTYNQQTNQCFIEREA